MLVELLGGLLIGGIFQVGSEKSEVLLFFGGIFLLGLVKFRVLTLNLLVNDASEPDSDVVVGAAWYLLAEILESLS